MDIPQGVIRDFDVAQTGVGSADMLLEYDSVYAKLKVVARAESEIVSV